MWGVQPAVWSSKSAQEDDVFIKYLATNCPWKNILPGPCPGKKQQNPTPFLKFFVDAIPGMWCDSKTVTYHQLRFFKTKWKRYIRMNTVETLHRWGCSPFPVPVPTSTIIIILFVVGDPELPEYLSLLLGGVSHHNKYLYSLNICLYKYTYFYIYYDS